MTFKTHLAVGAATTSLVAALAYYNQVNIAYGSESAVSGVIPNTATELGVAMVVGTYSALLPDIDSKSSRARKVVSRLTFAGFIGILALYLLSFYQSGFDISTLLSRQLIGAIQICIFILIGRTRPHREFTHSILFAFLIVGGVYFLSGSRLVTVASFIGILSHDLIDLPNTKRVHLAWPLGKGICFRWFKADGTGAVMVRYIALGILVVTMGYNVAVVSGIM